MTRSPSRSAASLLAVLSAASLGGYARAADCPTRTTDSLEVRGATLCLAVEDPTSDRLRLLRPWVERSARIVADYYGRFPAPRVLIELDRTSGSGIGGGRTTSDSGLKIHVSAGDAVTAQQLGDDWVLVHEMVHLALPELGRSHNWLAEGLAVYVEGVARAQAGNRDVADVWAENRHSMPMGLPRDGEGGMDQTPTWARTYWGGALFCLQAEVAIRQQTGNRVGLQTALRAILDQTGGYGFDREIDEVLRIGDAATGTRALEDLYRKVRSSPQAPDLDRLWDALGVPRDPRTQPFDDRAPLAAIRVAITAPRAKT